MHENFLVLFEEQCVYCYLLFTARAKIYTRSYIWLFSYKHRVYKPFEKSILIALNTGRI